MQKRIIIFFFEKEIRLTTLQDYIDKRKNRFYKHP